MSNDNGSKPVEEKKEPKAVISVLMMPDNKLQVYVAGAPVGVLLHSLKLVEIEINGRVINSMIKNEEAAKPKVITPGGGRFDFLRRKMH